MYYCHWCNTEAKKVHKDVQNQTVAQVLCNITTEQKGFNFEFQCGITHRVSYRIS